MIIAIDPGPLESAFVVYDGATLVSFGKVGNAAMLDRLRAENRARLVVEMIASYGMPVGAEVFETCLWIGRFIEAHQHKTERITRAQAKLHLCQHPRANDATVRQAIIDRYGGKDAAMGRKAAPGPLYGVSGDVWAALAVAITAHESTARYVWPPNTTPPGQ